MAAEQPKIQIDKDLNLVFETRTKRGERVFVHNVPISTDLFNAHWQELSDTYSYFGAKRERLRSGPKHAHRQLRLVAAENGHTEAIEEGLFPIIRRQTNVVVRTKAGWQDMMLTELYDSDEVEPAVRDEIEAKLVFFSAAWHELPLEVRQAAIQSLEKFFGWRTTSLDYMAWRRSLSTSIEAENSGEKNEQAA